MKISPQVSVNVSLPEPWNTNSTFEFPALPHVSWLVGPNGSGKSRFLEVVAKTQGLTALKPRLLGTDRLNEVRISQQFASHFGAGNFGNGINKSNFATLAQFHKSNANLITTLTLLDQRPELRIRLEATLSQLLDRTIRLEMVDGRLVPKARFARNPEYELFKSECHGVLELVVLLANIFDEETQLLLIDEPELNLHPQYQAFVLDAILKTSEKRFILATHSPFFLRIESLDDLDGLICFHNDFRVPTVYRRSERHDAEVAKLLPRMSAQHRSFFFASKPVFAEGSSDATVLTALQSAMELSPEAAGSGIVFTSGKDDAARFLMLCTALQKEAHFVFDLDALFDQRLETCVNLMPHLVKAFADAGHGTFSDHRGKFESEMSKVLQKIREVPASSVESPFRKAIGNDGKTNKERVTLLVEIHRNSSELSDPGIALLCSQIKGMREAIRLLLAGANVHILPGGCLENHVPEYTGNPYVVDKNDKAKTANAVIEWLTQTPRQRLDVMSRYPDLAEVVSKLPAKPIVDVEPFIKQELANLLHHLIIGIRKGEITDKSHVSNVLGDLWKRVATIVSLERLDCPSIDKFSGSIIVEDKFGIGRRRCVFDASLQTNNPNAIALTAIP